MGQETLVRDQKASIVRQLDSSTREITAEIVASLREMDDVQAAYIFDGRMVALERQAKRSFIEMGVICLEVQRRELWKRLIAPDWEDGEGRMHIGEPFHSIDAWIMVRLGVSRSSAYDAMKVLRTGAPVEDLQEMPRRNARRLAGLSTDVQRDPAIIEAAKGSEKSFLSKIQRDYPDQHIESTRAIVAKPTVTAREFMDLCFDVVCWAYDLTNREDVLENLCAYFMDGDCEREGWEGWHNDKAYEAARGK
jgi:hypothetical protein